MGIAVCRQAGKTDETWSTWYAWAWRRYDAARAAGGGCETACGECEEGMKWTSAVREFVQGDPEPARSAKLVIG